MQSSLERKQKYLRDHIHVDLYNEFYEFCEDRVGSVDINGWSMNQVQQTVYKFNLHQLELKNKKKKQLPISFHQYQQSSTDEYVPSHRLQDVKDTGSDYQSSKVEKSSIDILESAFDDFQTESNSSFAQFDAFSQQNVRKKSTTEFKRRNTQNPVHNISQNEPVMSQIYQGGKKSPYQKKQKYLQSQIKTMKEIKPQNDKEHLQKWLVEQVGFKDRITCFKSTVRSNLKESSLNVVIDDHAIVQKSFSNYVMYNMKVAPFGIDCKRNDDDFHKLKDNLRKVFPGHHIPYLQSNSWFTGTSIQFIKQHKKLLELFMRDLIKDDEIRNSKIFQDFLMLKEHKSMKRKFQKYDELQKPKGLEELCLSEGKVDVSINKQQDNYKQSLKHFIQRMDDLLQKYKGFSQLIQNQYYEISKTYGSLISLIGDLERQIKKFNTKVTMNEIKYLGSIFRSIKQSSREGQSNAKFEYELYRRKINPFIKYQRSNMLQLNKLIQINDRLTKSYERRCQVEKIAQNLAYNSEQARDGKRGIDEQSKNLIVLKYQVGYMNRQVCEEGRRVFDQMGMKFLERWQKLGESYLDKNIKSIEHWKNFTKIDKEKFTA